MIKLSRLFILSGVLIGACSADAPSEISSSGGTSSSGGGSSSGGSSSGGSSSGGSSSGGSSSGGQATTHTLGGTVKGLEGGGLTIESNGQMLSIAKGATTFAFPTKLAKGTAYAVTAKAQPTMPSQVCTISMGSGTISADVNSVAIECTTNTYTVNATLMGVTGTGLVLQNNAKDDLAVPSPAPGSVAFATKIASGANYAVTVKTHPTAPTQLCSVAGGTGTVVAGDISSVAVNCTNAYTVGGNVTGLAGSGLVLQNNAGADLPINADGTFAFPKPELTGAAYNVTIKTQPTNRWQTCTVTSGSGTVASANVTNVGVSCTTNRYAIKGTITGLSGTGLVLQNNLGDNLAVAAGSTAFTMPSTVLSGSGYAITVQTAPTGPSQDCVVTNGSGTIAGADVVNVALACTTKKFNVSARVTGLTGTGLVVQNNAAGDLTFNAAGTQAFATQVLSGAPYAVTIKTQTNAANETCYLQKPSSGTVTTADVTVNVICYKEKRVFVTSRIYSGNLGGLDGADAKCQALADAAGQVGTYRAWIGSPLGSPSTRFTQSSVPYKMVNGGVVANNWADLIDGTIGVPINVTELGGAPPASNPQITENTVWTGANANGTASSGDQCASWTYEQNANGTGNIAMEGRYLADGTWSAYRSWSGSPCPWQKPLYCFQQ